jgi:hypothetical protein
MQKLALDETQVSNGGEPVISSELPYGVTVSLLGTAPMLMKAWNIASIEAKAAAKKGSTEKKTDDLEASVYRTPEGLLGFPGVNLCAAIREAGRYMPDPRSTGRKSAMDLLKAGVVSTTIIAPFEPSTKTWDYEDARRVVVQRAGITRIRPAMREGWALTFDLMVVAPEYINPPILSHLISMAGRMNGLGDFRPTYGRFVVTRFETHQTLED